MIAMGTTPDGPALQALVSLALELDAEGQEVDTVELAGGDALLALRLAEALETARRLPGLFSVSTPAHGPGDRVLAGRYRVDGRLGSGAMGVVHQAFDQELLRPVAIKVLHAGLLDEEQARARFEREAEILASLHHPGVVTLHDRGETEDGEAFLVMELLTGCPLTAVLEQAHALQGRVEELDTRWIAAQLGLERLSEVSYLRACSAWAAELADGLGAVHASGGLHRDVKPSNVFLRSDGRAVLIDFGIATRAEDSVLTREGSTVGTPAYLAPECLDADRVPGPAQDIYGLAATLYHLVTGRAPYVGTPARVLTALALNEPTPLVRLAPGVPADLRAIIERGLAREPERRYGSAAELASDLRAFLEHRPVQARPTTAPQRALRRLRRSRVVRGAVATLGAAALVALGLGLHAHREAGRAEAHGEAWSHVLVNSAISQYPESRTTALPGSTPLTDWLDAAVASSEAPLPARLVRGAHRLDHGDHEGAAEDLRAVASAAGPFARALAERYEQANPEQAGLASLPEAELPAPVGPGDLLVASFHALRQVDYPTALEHLGSPELEGFAPAAELRLMFTPFLRGFFSPGVTTEELALLASTWHEEVVRHEESLGRRTALTAFLLGTALEYQKRWAPALVHLDEAIELAPYSTAPRINAGRAAFRLGWQDEAIAYLEPVITARPSYWRPYDTLIRALLESKRLEEAGERLAQAPFAASGGQARLRVELEADLLTLRAWEAEEEQSHEAAAALAREAVDRYDALEATGRFLPTPRSAAARALAAGDRTRLFDALLAGLTEAPVDGRRLDAVLRFTPEQLDEGNHRALIAYLSSLREHLSDPARMAPMR